MSPQLDVSDVLLDPDFLDPDLTYTRNTQIVGADGLAVDTPTTAPFVGVVTSDKGNDLRRQAEGSMIEGSILVHAYQLRLTAGQAGVNADIVTWRGRRFTVVNVKDYSTYGGGFTCCTCEPLDLSGAS